MYTGIVNRTTNIISRTFLENPKQFATFNRRTFNTFSPPLRKNPVLPKLCIEPKWKRTVFNRQSYTRFGGGSRKPLYESIRYDIRYQIVIVGGVIFCIVYYYTHLDEVPISGRKRMIDVSREYEIEEGEKVTQYLLEALKGKILPQNNRHTQAIRRVGKKLIESSDLPELQKLNWRFYVVDQNEANAFVLPNGAVFVFTGILPIMKDEGGLATVLSHEISHVIARHSAEKMVFGRIIFLMAILSRFLGLPMETDWLLVLGLERPFSRKTESEADHIGLLLMSKACYDPSNAVLMWNRMSDLEKKQGMNSALLKYISTHPVSNDRANQIQQWLPEALKETERNHCTHLKQQVKGTMDAYQIYNKNIKNDKNYDLIKETNNKKSVEIPINVRNQKKLEQRAEQAEREIEEMDKDLQSIFNSSDDDDDDNDW